jgi:hypothetical protein
LSPEEAQAFAVENFICSGFGKSLMKTSIVIYYRRQQISTIFLKIICKGQNQFGGFLVTATCKGLSNFKLL